MVIAAAFKLATSRMVRRMLGAPPKPVSPSTSMGILDVRCRMALAESCNSVLVSNPASGCPNLEAEIPNPLTNKAAFWSSGSCASRIRADKAS